MGEDLKDEREKGHVEYKDYLHQYAHHSFSMLSTMLNHEEATLHFTTSIEKDGNSPLTLSLFISF
jgi:hypothetical protein